MLLVADAFCAGGGPLDFNNAVDIFDAGSGRWSTAALSEGRSYLAATSLPSQGLAIFAGGLSSGLLFCSVDV